MSAAAIASQPAVIAPRSRLSPAQFAFATSKAPFPAFVGGFGSGKTAAGMARAIALKIMSPRCDVAYYLPTYPLIEDIAHRRFPDLCERKGWAYELNKTSNFISFPDCGRIVFRTMEVPERIVGYEVADSVVDEIDTLPVKKARAVWSKIIARNRQKSGRRNSVAVVTTPEGFRFVYEKWGRNPKPGYELHRARTIDNAANLPADYIDNLLGDYSPALQKAYLDGEFVNLTSGSVYPDFDRKTAHAPIVIGDAEALHIGMDFNVGNMSAIVSVIRGDDPATAQELTGVRDTPAMAELIKRRWPDRAISVYPDASGNSRKSVNAQESDLSILRAAGFAVRVNPSNPAVKDRIAAVNKIMPRWRINTDECPKLTESLEQQAFDDNGEPDKTGGHDHTNDAAGYFIAHRWPIVRRIAHVSNLEL